MPLVAAWRGRARVPPPLGAPSPLPTPVATSSTGIPVGRFARSVNGTDLGHLGGGLTAALLSKNGGLPDGPGVEVSATSSGGLTDTLRGEGGSPASDEDEDPMEHQWLTLIGTGGVAAAGPGGLSAESGNSRRLRPRRTPSPSPVCRDLVFIRRRLLFHEYVHAVDPAGSLKRSAGVSVHVALSNNPTLRRLPGHLRGEQFSAARHAAVPGDVVDGHTRRE